MIPKHYFKCAFLRGHRGPLTCKELKVMQFQLTMTPVVLTFVIFSYNGDCTKLHACGFSVFQPSEFEPNDINNNKPRRPL